MAIQCVGTEARAGELKKEAVQELERRNEEEQESQETQS